MVDPGGYLPRDGVLFGGEYNVWKEEGLQRPLPAHGDFRTQHPPRVDHPQPNFPGSSSVSGLTIPSTSSPMAPAGLVAAGNLSPPSVSGRPGEEMNNL